MACREHRSNENIAAEYVLSAGYVGDRENGSDGGRSTLSAARHYGALRPAFVRPERTAALATLANGGGRARENSARGFHGLSAFRDEAAGAELFELRCAGRPAGAFPTM